MTTFTIDLNPILNLTDEQFYQLCLANPEIKFELNTKGELIIMSPTGGETGNKNFELGADLALWNRRTQLGIGFDSSTCFRLPNGAERSPDVSWVEKSRWDALSPEEKKRFPPICPDFVLELMSPSDRLSVIQEKMGEYQANGVRLGWLINTKTRKVEIYRQNQEVECLESPETLSGEDVLPGFTLELAFIWQTLSTHD